MKLNPVLLLYVAAAGAGGFLVWKLWQAGPGVLSGDNPITRGAKDADGKPVTAYQGAGVVGTAGAVFNEASGGWLASLGEWIGGKAADVFQADPMADKPDKAKPAPASMNVSDLWAAPADATFGDLSTAGDAYPWWGRPL